MRHVKQSFTLVEILVVIVIIGILSSFIFFTINDSVEKANIAKSKMFEESIRNNLLLSLISEWNFDGPTTAGQIAVNDDVLDSWGSHNGDVGSHSPLVKGESECVSGKCLYFDGVTYVETDLIPDASPSTFSMWIKAEATGQSGLYNDSPLERYHMGPVESNSSWLVGCCNTYSYFAYDGDNPIDNGWYFILMSVKDSTTKFYVNGKYKDQFNFTDQTLTLPIYIGKRRGASGTNLIGSIDEVKIYNTSLPDAQIKQEFLVGLNNLYAKGLITELEYNNRLGEL
jgi:prepilin-type N-terminal cleavage/methylation domain-containing protein